MYIYIYIHIYTYMYVHTHTIINYVFYIIIRKRIGGGYD